MNRAPMYSKNVNRVYIVPHRTYAWKPVQPKRFTNTNRIYTKNDNRELESEKHDSAVSLDFPGFQQILDSKNGILHRSIWAIVTILCFAICIYQINDRVVLFLEYPVTAEYQIVKNHTLKYPSFSVCAYPESYPQIAKLLWQRANSTKLSDCFHKVYSLIDYLQITPDELWKIMNAKTKIAFTGFVSSMEISPLFETKEVISPMGTCVTYKIKEPVLYMGQELQFRIEGVPELRKDSCTSNTFMVIPHDDDIEIKYLEIFLRQEVQQFSRAVMSLTVKEFISVNISTNPCHSSVDVNRCWNRCIEEKLRTMITCRLPFMDIPSRPNCNDTKSSHHSFAMVKRILGSLNPAYCPCTKKCHDKIFVTNVKVDDTGKPMNNCRIDIYFEDNNVERITEKLAYSTVSFLCDIGGNLGLYLGLCVLSLLELIDQISMLIKKSCQQWIKKEAKQQRNKY